MQNAWVLRWRVAAGVLMLAGCALGLPEIDDSYSSSGYGGGSSGIGGSLGHSGEREEYRGTLPAGSYTESCRAAGVQAG